MAMRAYGRKLLVSSRLLKKKSWIMLSAICVIMIMRLKESICHVWPGRFGTYRIAWKGWYYPTPAWYACLGEIDQRPRDTLKGREIISPFLTPWWVWYQYRTVWVWSLILFAPLHIPNLNSVHVGVASSMMWWDIFIAKTANSKQHPYQHHCYFEACPNMQYASTLSIDLRP